ncbi:MAG: LamG-like jellyroll fold domain-containing protein [Akkermansiaceae bacterium]
MKLRKPTITAFCAATFAALTLSAQAQLRTGLLNYWPLDGNAQDTASDYPDTTGVTEDDGTVNGSVTFDSSQTGFGQAASFPGGDGNDITVPDSAASSAGGVADDVDRTASDMSLSLWFKASSWTGNWQAIIAHGEGQDYRIARQGLSSPVRFAGVAGTTDIQSGKTFEEPTPNPEVWHHVVITATDGGFAQFYIDGQLEGTSEGLNDPTVSIDASDAGNAANNQNILAIGSNPERTGRAFHGLIDDVAMWDRALTAAEVTEIYDAGVAGVALSNLLSSGDSDLDGLPNEWETLYGLNPDSADGDDGASGDPDMDGATNIQEFERGSFPNDNDSDDDTILDGAETKTGTWVSTVDRGTDPLKKDSDEDGLEDNVETNTNTFVDANDTGTNPNVADSDTDTMPDGYEVTNGLNPTTDDGALDLDEDTLSNLSEFTNGTEPDDKDSDGDTLEDNVETKTGTYVDTTDTGTDPLLEDTDNDGIRDDREDNTGTLVDENATGTDPNNPDTDNDGAPDGAELLVGRDPNNPNDGPTGLGAGLLSYWTFNDTLSDVAHTLRSDSAVADDGEFVGPDTDVNYAADGLFGSSLTQNGGTGYVEVQASIDTLRGDSDGLTVSAWIKVPAFTSNWQTLIAHGEASQWRIARRSNESTVGYAGGAPDIPGAGVGPIVDDGEWHHVVGISDPDAAQVSLYVDGVLVTTGNAPDIQNVAEGTTPNLFIGSNPQRPNREWNGQIDDLGIWGRALSEEEILSIYNDGSGASIEALLGGGGPPLITSIVSDNGEITLTWTSTEGANYSIFASANLENWPAEVADGITGESGTTSFTFDNPDPTATKLFFRVEPPRP